MRGTVLGGPYNKDCCILGSILGSPDFGKLPHTLGKRYVLGSYMNPLGLHWGGFGNHFAT